jgi:hypothetical protein
MQLEITWRDAASLQRDLELHSGLQLGLTLTDNRSTMMTVKRNTGGQGAEVRVHRMFLAANPGVVKALALWIRRDRCRRSGRVLDSFIQENQHLVRGPSPKRRLRTGGTHFDLERLYREVNAAEFDGTVDVGITWGRRPARRSRRSIRFGSFTPTDNLVRIHPYLDQAFVPEYFVRYIVFHEMLHAHLGIEELPSGRRSIHTREFCNREQIYPDFERSVAWQDDSSNLRRLLR